VVNANIQILVALQGVTLAETVFAILSVEKTLQIALKIVGPPVKMNVPIRGKLKKDATKTMFKKESVVIMIQILVLSGHLGKQFRIAEKTNGQTIIVAQVTGFKEKKSKEDVQIINVMKIVNG